MDTALNDASLGETTVEEGRRLRPALCFPGVHSQVQIIQPSHACSWAGSAAVLSVHLAVRVLWAILSVRIRWGLVHAVGLQGKRESEFKWCAGAGAAAVC